MQRLLDGLSDLLLRREMDDAGDIVIGEGAVQQLAVQDGPRTSSIPSGSRSVTPDEMSSSTTTFSPAAVMASATCAPMYPAPPVISQVMAASLGSAARFGPGGSWAWPRGLWGEAVIDNDEAADPPGGSAVSSGA